MLFFIYVLIFVAYIHAEDTRCPFQSCSNTYGTQGCTINCESKQFPLMDPIIEKRIWKLRLNNLENIPKNAFQFLEITNLEIECQNLKFIDDEAFANINKLDRLHLSNIRDISLILNKNKLQFLYKITTTLSIFNSSLNENNVLSLLDQIKTWTKLEKLELNGNLFKNFIYDFNSFQNLKTLSLSDNSIETLDIKSQMLTELNINKNQIIKLDKEMFKNLPKLERLNLESNNISKVFNDSFLLANNLISINLNRNFINYIEPNSFCELKSLKRLMLSYNNLSSIRLYCLHNVSYLFLSNVGYEGEIDQKRIGDPINVFYLYLSDNKINKISFEQMTGLNKLDLSSNNLAQLTENTVRAFPNLKELNIQNNKFTQEVFENLKTLKLLNFLYISNNFLTEIKPSHLIENVELYILDADRNQINKVEFPLLPRFIKLNLRGNKLKIIQRESFSNLKLLTELNLDSNLISQIHSKAFIANEVLKELSIANNYLTQTPDIRMLTLLTNLNLNNNSINYLSKNSFERYQWEILNSKIKIDLRNNNIRSFSTNTFCTKNGSSLSLKGFELHLDDVNKMDKCMFRQLDSKVKIQSILKPSCEHLLMARHVKMEINGDISQCSNVNLNIIKECYSGTKFQCPKINEIFRYTTWITGDPHLLSYQKNYEFCSIGKDAVCFQHNDFQLLCSDTYVGGPNKQATVLTNLKLIYKLSNSENVHYEATGTSFPSQFNNKQSIIYENQDKNKKLIEITEIENGFKVIFIPNSNTHIFITKWQTYYSIALRTTHETYSESKGILYEGCLQQQDKSLRKRQISANSECETVCSNIEFSAEDENFPNSLIRQICEFDCIEMGKNSTIMVKSMANNIKSFILSDQYPSIQTTKVTTYTTPSIETTKKGNTAWRSYQNQFLNFGLLFTTLYYFNNF